MAREREGSESTFTPDRSLLGVNIPRTEVRRERTREMNALLGFELIRNDQVRHPHQ